MTTEYELHESTFDNVCNVGLNSSYNDTRIDNLAEVQNINDNIKSNVGLPALQHITLPLCSEVKYSLAYICRLCGCLTDVNSTSNIFPDNKFQEHLVVKVYGSDPIPKTVCKAYSNKINQFYEVSEKCILAEDKFGQTYVSNRRCLDKLSKKKNQKSDLDLLKSQPEVNEQLHSLSNFQHIENSGINQSDSNSVEHSIQEKMDLSLNTSKQLKSDSFEIEKPKQIEELASKKSNYDNTEITNSCKLCCYNIKNLNDFLKHSRTHFTTKLTGQFLCSLCKMLCQSKIEWETHIKEHFVGQDQEIKDKTIVLEKKVLKHQLKVLNKLKCCKKCRESLDDVDTAVEHCLRHKPANIKSYSCILCAKRVGKSKLREHVSLHYPILSKPIFPCNNCNNFYADEKMLKYHRCSKLRQYKCSQCKQSFKNENRLKFHEDFHKTKSTFCDICKKDFKFESKIYLHFAAVHNGIRDKPHCCDVCGRNFTWLTVLNSHKRTHTNERPFKCAKCDARFFDKYSLSGHMPSHDDHPKFYCDKCDYYTGRKLNLQKHASRFHREINSSQLCIKCKVCNEIFPNKHHIEVEKHFLRHPNEEMNKIFLYTSNKECRESELFQELEVTKLFQCERCERCYASADHLTQHRGQHSAEDSGPFYQCRLCDSGFAKHDLLVKHQKVHVNISSQYTSKLSVLTVISCGICGIECVDYRQLLNHKDRGNCRLKKISGTVGQRKVLIKKYLKPLRTHQLFVNSSGLFECPSCQRTYKNRRRYRLHLATHPNIFL